MCDGKYFRLALSQSRKLDKGFPQTLGYVLQLLSCHPESKSLAPDGSPDAASTCGLLARFCYSHYVALCRQRDDRRWERGEDLSLVSFKPVEYSPSGKMAVADQALLNEMAKHPLREMTRKTGLS